MIKNSIIFGAGYVGSAISVVLSEIMEVTVYDIDPAKLMSVNDRSIFSDEQYSLVGINKDSLKLKSIESLNAGLYADLAIIALPTNFDEKSHYFNTSIIENAIHLISSKGIASNILIKSTLPLGFCNKISDLYPDLNIFYSPEFLREDSSLWDCFHPSRIVIGANNENEMMYEIENIFQSVAKNDPQSFFMSNIEAEAVKLFSNTFLANRISFFNELDSYCFSNGLDSSKIISAVSADSRIGNYYNNPSFGYGGYCLPKDTKQLVANYNDIPQILMSALIESNYLRKEFIAKKIIEKNAGVIGIFRLIMKENSDNYRESAILDILKIIQFTNPRIYIYEPLLKDFHGLEDFHGFKLLNSLEKFKSKCDLIVANRMHDELLDVKSKVFTRDIRKFK